GGYVTGLLSGIIISIPAMFHGEHLSLPLLASIGVLGGLLRDIPADPGEIWRFSPMFELNLYRFFRETQNYRRSAFYIPAPLGILFAEFLRQQVGHLFTAQQIFFLDPVPKHWFADVALYASTLFAVGIPLKIWNSTRNEKKLEEQERLLVEARLAALTSQIN